MSNVKAYRQAIEESISALELLLCEEWWDYCGLSDVLIHLKSVHRDLQEGEIRRALGQYSYVFDKYERFSWAVHDFRVGPKVTKLFLQFAGSVGKIPYSRKYGDFIRPDV